MTDVASSRRVTKLVIGCVLFAHFWFFGQASWLAGEGDGTPLQHSCLENPMDRGAW